MPHLVVASFNVHAGVDGWGRPFDVVAACRSLDADVLVVQEAWAPLHGGGTAEKVSGLGYSVHRAVMGRGRMLPPHPRATSRWGPRPRPGRGRAVRLAREGSDTWAGRSSQRGVPGVTELVVFSRLEVIGSKTADLGRLSRDRARRSAITVTVSAGGATVEIVGTHMSHLSQGSPIQFRRLRAVLPDPGRPAVLAGDMNLFGPAVSLVLPGWRRAVKARTWPAWAPIAQPDHILVTDSVEVSDAAVAGQGGSDHLAVRARLEV